jgi:hypothetical protein
MSALMMAMEKPIFFWGCVLLLIAFIVIPILGSGGKDR